MWALKTISYAGLYLMLCLASLYDPIFGVVNYMLIYQIDPRDTWWGMPLHNLGIRFSMVAALFLIAGMIISSRKVPRIRPFIDPFELGLIAFVFVAFLSVLIGGGYSPESAARLDKFWKMLLFVFIFGRIVSTRRNLHIALWTIVLGTLYLGREAFIASPDKFAQGRLNAIGGADFRYSSGIAAHLAATLPLVGAVFLISKRWFARLLTLGTGAFAFNALILCRTRSAVIGLIAGGVVAALLAPKRRRMRIYLAVLVCTPVALRLADAGFWSRMETLTDAEARANDPAVITRLEIWNAAIRMIWDHPFGVGAGNFERIIRYYHYEKRASHSSLLNCVAELGIHAGILYVALLLAAFRKLHRVNGLADRTDAPTQTRLIAYGVLVALVTLIVAGIFTERFYAESFWWILALPLCLQRVAEREVAERSSTAEASLELEEDPQAMMPDAHPPQWAAPPVPAW